MICFYKKKIQSRLFSEVYLQRHPHLSNKNKTTFKTPTWLCKLYLICPHGESISGGRATMNIFLQPHKILPRIVEGIQWSVKDRNHFSSRPTYTKLWSLDPEVSGLVTSHSKLLHWFYTLTLYSLLLFTFLCAVLGTTCTCIYLYLFIYDMIFKKWFNKGNSSPMKV